MKKILMTVLTVLLMSLLAATLVACVYDPNVDGDGPNNYTRAKYTVTFNTTTQMTVPPITGVEHGSTISAPKDGDGNELIPLKAGYEFVGWSATNNISDLFDFEHATVTSNITLTAKFRAREYKHTVNLRGKLIYNEDGTYSIDEDGYEEGFITLGAADLNESTTTLKNTFNSSSNYFNNATVKDGEKFMFWYYMTEKRDEDGEIENDVNGDPLLIPVQLTRIPEAESSNARAISTYTLTHPLTIYPMLKSNLPKVTVEFYNGEEGNKVDTKEIIIGDNFDITDAPSEPTLDAEHSFSHWYYVLESKDENDEPVFTNHKFVFAEDGVNGTDLMDVTGAVDNYFAVKTLKVYAKWVKNMHIGGLTDYDNFYNQLHNPSIVEAEREELLNSKLFIDSDIDFGSTEYEPLFDADNRFMGIIDGGIYSGGDSTLTGKHKLSGGVFGNETHASVFGYVEGRIINLDFENIGLKTGVGNDGKYAEVVYMAAVVTQNSGEIVNCDVKYTQAIELNYDGADIIFGGVAALNSGVAEGNGGRISRSSFTAASITANLESIAFGGIAGRQNAYAVITDTCKVSINDFTVACTGNNTAAKIGGIVGENSGNINMSRAEISVSGASSPRAFFFGGICATNLNGTVGQCSANAILCNETKPAEVGGTLSQQVCIGGMIGHNEGTVINSYCYAELFVKVVSNDTIKDGIGSLVSVGGLVGSNSSSSIDRISSQTRGIGAINYCYSDGKISVEVEKTLKNIKLYVGGIAGRNNQSKLSTLFSLMTINVVNENGVNNIGQLFGTMEKNSAGTQSTVNNAVYYATDVEMKLNGIKYERVQLPRPSDAGDDYVPEYDETFKATVRGTAATTADFKNVQFVLGDDDVSAKLGFSKDVWTQEEGSLPTLKIEEQV